MPSAAMPASMSDIGGGAFCAMSLDVRVSSDVPRMSVGPLTGYGTTIFTACAGNSSAATYGSHADSAATNVRRAPMRATVFSGIPGAAPLQPDAQSPVRVPLGAVSHQYRMPHARPVIGAEIDDREERRDEGRPEELCPVPCAVTRLEVHITVFVPFEGDYSRLRCQQCTAPKRENEAQHHGKY